MQTQSAEEIINCFLSAVPVLIISSPLISNHRVITKLPPHYNFIAPENIFSTLFKIKEEQTNKIL